MKTQLDTEIDSIPHQGLRELTRLVMQTCPDCFWTMPASTSGKYHPAISLGSGGLVRHTRAVVHLTRHMLEWEGVDPENPNYSAAIAAAIMHDCCKKTDAEKHTAFTHPLRAVELIERVAAAHPTLLVPPATLRTTCAIVAAHMGRWNTSRHAAVTLPEPCTPLQRCVSIADFLASRKDVPVTLEPQSGGGGTLENIG